MKIINDNIDAQVKCLRRYAAECFPEITNGQKHFVRVLMESVADELEGEALVQIEQLQRENAELRRRNCEQCETMAGMQKLIDQYAEQAIEDGHD